MRKIIKLLIGKLLFKLQIRNFYLVFGGHIFFQTLRTAIQLGVFDLIEENGSLSRREIAEKLKLAEQPVRIVLLGLTSVGFLRKKRGKYKNSYIAKIFFLKSSPNNVRSYIELQHQVIYKGVYWLADSVRQNKNVGLKELPGNESTLYERLAHIPETEAIFQNAMRELSLHANSVLQKRLDLSNVNFLVDVGGGDGTNILALARKWPHLKASVFDLPSVCNIATAHIKENALSTRLTAIAGNCFEDDFPKGTDALMFCHFFTIWGEKKDRELLAKCYKALPENGRVIIFNMMQKNNEKGPLSAAVGSPYFLSIATGFGMLYTSDEYKRWMLDAGFKKVEVHHTEKDHGIVVGVK